MSSWACRSIRPEASSPLSAAPATDVQCEPRLGLKGGCVVTDVNAGGDTATESVRSSEVSSLKEILIEIPPQGVDAKASLEFSKGAQRVEEWAMVGAMDLYNRAGCVSQVAGGVFGEGYTARITARLILNQHDNGRTGFAEISDLRSGTAVNAVLGLKCTWSR